jgi:hypothetical protein
MLRTSYNDVYGRSNSCTRHPSRNASLSLRLQSFPKRIGHLANAVLLRTVIWITQRYISGLEISEEARCQVCYWFFRNWFHTSCSCPVFFVTSVFVTPVMDNSFRTFIDLHMYLRIKPSPPIILAIVLWMIPLIMTNSLLDLLTYYILLVQSNLGDGPVLPVSMNVQSQGYCGVNTSSKRTSMKQASELPTNHMLQHVHA